MDRVIDKPRRPLWQWVLIAVLLAVAGSFAGGLLRNAAINAYRVPHDQLTISTVQSGQFEDAIPIRGTIQPLNSVYLDAVNGGVVEEVFVEEGSFVEAGQPLVQLSNNNLRLSAAQNDTQITEQLNFLSNISNDLETQKLNTERQLIDTEYRITVLERQKRRFEQLVGDSLVSQEEYEAIRDELEYQYAVRDNTLARQDLENKIRVERSNQIALQISKLEENLEVSQSSFESLLVRAPISGQLTSLPVEIGENMLTGERLGQIDVVNQYKIVAQIDEYYVSRVAAQQSARFSLAGQQFIARAIKVYPEISNGTFEVDLVFDGDAPDNVRRGQTLQMELTLGSPVESLLLPIGGFVQETGGNWVFVVDDSGREAVRRDIQVGRRNNRYMEIQSGLQAGDRVITSGYSQMGDVDRVLLSR
jgi:HlyD family secretion protein